GPSTSAIRGSAARPRGRRRARPYRTGGGRTSAGLGVRYCRPMARPIKRVALSTGGGDAPGLNAVIRAATLAARNRGWDVVGIRDGFNGILSPDSYAGEGVITLMRDDVRGIVNQGGTILGTTNRGNPIAFPVQQD